MPLVYMPEKVWSTRYGPDYFTVGIIGFRINERGFAQYELQVQNGKRHWTLLRRFRDFDRVRYSGQLSPYKNLPPLPPKTYCCRDLNPDFLAQRKEKLQKFLQDLLATPGLPEEPDVRAFLLLQSSEALYV